jgi:hypothetical protein
MTSQFKYRSTEVSNFAQTRFGYNRCLQRAVWSSPHAPSWRRCATRELVRKTPSTAGDAAKKRRKDDVQRCSDHRCRPTGLVLALWLTRLGVKRRIVNKTAEPGATSRALGGPSCEHSKSTDSLTSPITVVAHRHKVPAVNLWVKGEPATRLCDLTWGGA